MLITYEATIQNTLRFKYKRRAMVSTLALVGMLLQACQTSLTSQKPDPALSMLNSVAMEVQRITRRVNEIQQTNNATYREPVMNDQRLETKILNTDYVGPPNYLLQELARRIGYRFVASGIQNSPSGRLRDSVRNPLNVIVKAQQETVINLIREVGSQLGGNAIVSVSEPSKLIRLELL